MSNEKKPESSLSHKNILTLKDESASIIVLRACCQKPIS